MTYRTEQEHFWAGAFGDAYVERNQGNELIAANIALFSKALAATRGISSVIEFGANVGLNLVALRRLLPQVDLAAVEINQRAVASLEQLDQALNGIRVYPTSMLDFAPDMPRDLVLCKGVLIHVNPDALSAVYDTIYRASRRYILLAEYYNPSPMEITYRGHTGKLFKRDFAGEMLDRFPDLALRDYGFVYRRDPVFPQDDVNWFLLQRT